MRHKAIFLPKPGYACLAYGYGRGIVEGQEERIRAYYELKKLAIDGTGGLWAQTTFKSVELAGIFMEPKSVQAIKTQFRMRPVGKELIHQLRPGDHLIVDTLDRLGDEEDIISLDRHFGERSITLHVIDLGGCSVNFSSPTGHLIMNIHLAGTEFQRSLKADQFRVRQARLRAKQLHAGGGVPFHCLVHNKKLVFRKWAVAMMEKVVAWADAGLGPVAIFRAIKENQIPGCRRIKSVRHVTKLENFYRKWTAAGRPDITSFKEPSNEA